MDSGGTGSRCRSRLADGEAAALTAPSQCSFSPFRSSWDSSWRKRFLSCSHSSDQNCRTWDCPALSKLCLTCSKESIVTPLKQTVEKEIQTCTHPASSQRAKGDVFVRAGNDMSEITRDCSSGIQTRILWRRAQISQDKPLQPHDNGLYSVSGLQTQKMSEVISWTPTLAKFPVSQQQVQAVVCLTVHCCNTVPSSEPSES